MIFLTYLSGRGPKVGHASKFAATTDTQRSFSGVMSCGAPPCAMVGMVCQKQAGLLLSRAMSVQKYRKAPTTFPRYITSTAFRCQDSSNATSRRGKQVWGKRERLRNTHPSKGSRQMKLQRISVAVSSVTLTQSLQLY